MKLSNSFSPCFLFKCDKKLDVDANDPLILVHRLYLATIEPEKFDFSGIMFEKMFHLI